MALPVTMSAADVVELRQYTLHPGARSDLVRLFERELIEPQEAVGMRVGGIFLDRDDPDRFVWFRGFADMDARRRALEAFYYGPVWKEFRDAANATMIDSDDVLLLRPTEPAHPAPDPAGERAPASATGPTRPTDEWVTVTVYAYPPDAGLEAWLATDFHQAVQDQLGAAVATYRTESAENDFPALPVRSDNVFVWTASFGTEDEYDAARARLQASRAWQDDIAPRLASSVSARQYLRLQPTARSQHPAPAPARTEAATR
ncbi:NIPSNAP family protein [Nocardioides antri]|uniref:NIPSNAP family protein n=1 Tax=Nocardioides antri TaxID=2607659 RepID=A0A5B1M0Z8_9ACTN|nr:NIPSNAP family protein [Nocardioides antri]KAA1425789.1 NIPSNAP family protein [Nocardioides antri]